MYFKCVLGVCELNLCSTDKVWSVLSIQGALSKEWQEIYKWKLISQAAVEFFRLILSYAG